MFIVYLAKIFTLSIFFMGSHRLSCSMSSKRSASANNCINDVKRNEYTSIIVIIIGCLEPMRSRGTDYVTTVDVLDEYGNVLDIKIFTETPKYARFFRKNDIIRITHVKRISERVAITGRDSNIEVLAHVSEVGYKTFTTETEKKKIHRLRNYYAANGPESKIPLWKIEDIKEHSTFAFKGLLAALHRESNNLTVMSMIDYTINPHVKVFTESANINTDMILYVKIWGNCKGTDKLEVGKMYHIKKLKTKKLGIIMEAIVSESYFTPPLLINTDDEDYKTVMLAKENFFNSRRHKDQQMHMAPLGHNIFEVWQISEIKNPGVFRIIVDIFLHYPFEPATVRVCHKCKSVSSEDVNLIDCPPCKNLPSCTPITEKFCKLQVRDSTAIACIVLKNKLVDVFFQDERNLRKKYLDCIVIYNKKTFFMLNADFYR